MTLRHVSRGFAANLGFGRTRDRVGPGLRWKNAEAGGPGRPYCRKRLIPL